MKEMSLSGSKTFPTWDLAATAAAAAVLSGVAAATQVPNLTLSDGGLNATNFFKSPAQVLSVPLKRVDHAGVATPSISRRFFKADVLGVYGAAYLAELNIGTSSQPQIVDVLIDTGSFELWVNPDCATSNVPDFCNAFGHYDPSKSSTSQMLSTSFDIKYGSGEASGPYYKDDIFISGAKVEQQQFGVANESDLVWFGIMGLGYGLGNGFINYPLIIDSLVAQGYTNSKLFSLDLGGQPKPAAAITGEMVFGGVDTNKYAGNLKKVPVDQSDPHYAITLNSLSLRTPGSPTSNPFIDQNLPLPVIVDSGTTLSLLPESLVTKLAAQFPGAASDGKGGYTVPCSLQDQDGSVDFGFLAADGTVTISVKYKDFIWNSGGNCFLGAWYSSDIGVWILGDTFLRGAYVTFDQSNNALYMANYVSCGTDSNLVPVPAGPDAAARIPGSCNVAAAPSASPTQTQASLASGNPSSTAIPPAASSLGGDLNPIDPASPTSSIPTSSTGTQRSRTPAGGDVRPTIDTTPTTTTPTTTPITPTTTTTTTTTTTPTTPIPTPTTVPLNDPTESPPGAPAQGGDGADPTDLPRVGAAGTGNADPPPRTTTTIITITSTVTRALVYTVTSCPSSPGGGGGGCSVGQVGTRFEEVVTTFCPGQPGDPALSSPSAPAGTTTAAGGSRSQPPVLQPAPGPVQQQQQQQEITTITERCSTTTHAVTSCATGDGYDDACTLGQTTTRVITLTETVVVQANAVATSSIPPAAAAAVVTAADLPSTTATATGGLYDTSADSSASSSSAAEGPDDDDDVEENDDDDDDDEDNDATTTTSTTSSSSSGGGGGGVTLGDNAFDNSTAMGVAGQGQGQGGGAACESCAGVGVVAAGAGPTGMVQVSSAAATADGGVRGMGLRLGVGVGVMMLMLLLGLGA
ncbi:acid protease [Xylariomycetidae sp. FL2044]|nr:acid protease [Xylariomycetidae sp. FL2044]